MQRLPGGIWPVMLTPFTEEGDIDFHGLEALTEFYLEKGASGLFANCLSSEMYQLSPDERISLTEHVVRFAAGRVPVVSTGTFSADQKTNVEFISRIYNSGVVAVVVNSNQLCENSDHENLFQAQLEKLVNASGNVPLGMYECPLPYKRLITKDTLAWMATSGRFSYFKDTCSDNEQIRSRLSLTESSLLSLYNAHTPAGIESLRDGAAGLSPIGANFYPELFSYSYKNARKEEPLEFASVRQFLEDNDKLLHALYPLSAKYFLQKRGLPITTCTRAPLPRIQKEEISSLRILQSMMEGMFELIGLPS